MLVIFCSNPLRRMQPDPDYAAEMEAAQAAGCDVALMSYEALLDDANALAAVERIPARSVPEVGLYRGWMMRPSDYTRLYEALAQRGVTLLNDPDAYRACHELPASYSSIEEQTPATVWLSIADGIDDARILRALQPFGAAPVIVKDFVKSRKHEWNEACFIPSATDERTVLSVVHRFLQLQGDDLYGGLVFRAYTPLEPLATHPKSGMPLAREYRRFYLDGALLTTCAYWDGVEDASAPPPTDLFAQQARRIPSRFFTMDIARTQAGGWLILELGDGQVAGLPEHLPAPDFYQSLASALDVGSPR